MRKSPLFESAMFFVFLLTVTPGLFYVRARFFDPSIGLTDFFRYQEMYLDPGNLSVTTAPFIYRQVSAFLVHAVHSLSLPIPFSTSFQGDSVNLSVYFSALLTNYLSVLLGLTVIFGYLRKCLNGTLGAITASLPIILATMQLQVVYTGFSGLIDGVSLGLLCAIYVSYLARNHLTFALLTSLMIFQRELVLVIMGAIALVDLVTVKSNRKFSGFAFILSFSCFAVYLAVRTVLFPSDGYANQTDPFSLASNLVSFDLGLNAWALVVGSNGFAVVSAVLSLRVLGQAGHDRAEIKRLLTHLAVAFFVILALGLAAGIGVNIARVTIYATPMIVILFASALWVQVQRQTRG